MTNLICATYMLLVTNWSDVTPEIGWTQNRDMIVWNSERSKITKHVGHVRTNTYVECVLDDAGKITSRMLMKEGEPFLEITREVTPVVTTIYSTNETAKPYTAIRSLNVTNGGNIWFSQ